MSKEEEEAEVQAPAESVQTEIADVGTTTPQVQESAFSQAASSVLGAMDGMIGMDEIKDGLTKEMEGTPKEEVTVVEEKKVNVDNVDEVGKDLLAKQTSEEAAITEKEKEKEKEEKEKEELSVESVVFGGKEVIKKKGGEKKDEVNFDNQKEIDSFIKENTGYDDLNSLISDSTENKEKLEGLSNVTAKVENYERIFNNMPPELYKGVTTFFAGGDWKTEVNSTPNLDFNKGIDDQDSKKLINSYFPGKFTEQDWEDYKSEDAEESIKRSINLALEVSKEKFEADQTKISNIRTLETEDTKKKVEAYNTSLDATISNLQEVMPNVDKMYLNKMKKSLTPEALTETFYNKDGSLKVDAAQKLMMANEGFNLYEQYKKIAENRAETKQVQEILERTSDTPRTTKRATTQKDEVSPEVQKLIDDMKGLNPVQHF